MKRTPTGAFSIRIQLLPRQYGAVGSNNEGKETWPSSGRGYSAANEALNAGEQLQAGVAASTGSRKLRIRGLRIPVQTVDRILIVATGEIYNVTGVSRDFDANDTILNVDRATQQQTTTP
jgi:hypothetical protein